MGNRLLRRARIAAVFGVLLLMSLTTMASMYAEYHGKTASVPDDVFQVATVALALLFLHQVRKE